MSTKQSRTRTLKDKQATRKLTSLNKGNIQATLRSLTQAFRKFPGEKENWYITLGVPNEIIESAIEMQVDVNGLAPDEARKQGTLDALNEHIAGYAVDFFSEVTLLYGICVEFHEGLNQLNAGFPPGFNYRFTGKDIRNGADYVEAVNGWIDTQMDSPDLFPENDTDQFAEDFHKQMTVIFKRLNRIYAIMFTACLEAFTQIGAAHFLYTSYKRFYFFMHRYDLNPSEKEFEPFTKVDSTVMSLKALKSQYTRDKAESEKK